MTTVYPSSRVSIFCDCPYAGKTREIKEDPGNDTREKNQLQKEIKKTREDLIVARSVLIVTHRKLATFRRLLELELGWVIHPNSIPETTWRDRVREKAYLKSEQIHLVDYLRRCDPNYRGDPSVQPTKLSASIEDLLFLKQQKALKKLYHDYTVCHSENEKRAGTALWEFLELKENYENKLYHNKILEREIIYLKEKISALQRQFLEDKCLIDYITQHHFQMKGCFLERLPEKNTPEEGIHAEDIEKINTLDSEALKFKEMWEKSRQEKGEIANNIQKLKRKMESVNQRIFRAENICSRNMIELRILTRKTKENVLLSALQPRRKENFGKFSLIEYRSQRSQIEAAMNENNYLRSLLRKVILSKTDDLKRFQHSLLYTAEKYRVMLEDIRSNSQKAEQK